MQFQEQDLRAFKPENAKTFSFMFSTALATFLTIASQLPQDMIDTGVQGGFGEFAKWAFIVISVSRVFNIPNTIRKFGSRGR